MLGKREKLREGVCVQEYQLWSEKDQSKIADVVFEECVEDVEIDEADASGAVEAMEVDEENDDAPEHSENVQNNK